MRRLSIAFLAAAVSTLVLTQFASAADMPVKAPLAPPAVIPYSWTGFYVGINGGYSWGPWHSTDLSGVTVDPKVDGWLGGLQAGYNWQIDQRWVIGLEGDIQITGEKDSDPGISITTDVQGTGNFAAFHTITSTTVANEWKFPWFGTFRGRVGALIDPTLLIYGTGGLAVGNFKVSSAATTTTQTFRGVVGTTTNPLGPPVTTGGGSVSETTTRVGWALGAGLEKKFTPNWSAKLEYLYLDFGTDTFFSDTGSNLDIKLRDHILRVGLNYRFN